MDPDPDGLERFPATGMHNDPSHPKAMTCRCGRPRTSRLLYRIDGSYTTWLYCPRCDEIPPMQVRRPKGES